MRSFEGFRRGVNLGGWISQFKEYDVNHFNSFITEKDIEDIASLGFDHVRVPVDYNVLEDEQGNAMESGFRYLDNCRLWCEKHGLNMLIDLHECFGYSFDPLKKDMDRRKFFYDEVLQKRFFSLWEKIADRFKGYPDQVAFEPLNEVVLFEVKDAWNGILRKYIKLIRSIAPESYIVVGGVFYNSVMTVAWLDVPVDPKIVYNFHCYEPIVFTHQGAYWQEQMPLDFRIGYPKSVEEYRQKHREIYRDTDGAVFMDGLSEMGVGFFERIFEPAVAKAEKDNVALYCGEYGVIDKADNNSKKLWLKDINQAFDKYAIGRALWNYKEKDFGLVGDSSFEEVASILGSDSRGR
ncbi:MAG: cellulase family glycosylhydrolase [Spirochaetales bacterium]|nr:cellulase family glycosylhydrolase [Spirochaetales bacterium]